MARRRRVAVITAVISVIAAIATASAVREVSVHGGSDRVTTGSPKPDTTSWRVRPPISVAPISPTTTASPSPARPAPSTPVAPVPVLREGDQGPAVLALQQRLSGLGYWLANMEGRFDESTVHAVVAFQKVQGVPRDGIAGPVTLRALAGASRPPPRSHGGRVIEIDLARQVLLVVVDGRTEWVMDTCTGARAGSTPTGLFRVFRQVDGYDRSPLGVLYRPKYFYNGVALHGFPSVPSEPASHGCVRVTDAEMDWLWTQSAMPVGTEVWVY